MEVLGRENAKEILDEKLKNKKAELVVVLGRRRIGKTFLIREYLKEQIIFRYTGLYKGNLVEHMERYAKAVTEYTKPNLPISPPSSWFEAFDILRQLISSNKSKKKKVVFLDEFPWMATNRSRFLTAFTDFWNSFAAERKDLVVIICGSSASWMINKVLKNKGGLHNRVTERIFLEPFTLKETKQFFKYKGLVLPEYEILKIYMAMGGVPYYLDQMVKGESTVQAIDRICFAKNAVLRIEYDEIMNSLFNYSVKHQSIIDVLNNRPQGLLREQLLKETGLKSGGGTSGILEELETSGFIVSHIPYGKKNKDKIYKLKDQYLIFYHKFIKGTRPQNKKIWDKIFTAQSYTSWTGLAFENICADYEKKLRNKIAVFNAAVKHRKALFPTMVTTFGLIENQYSNGLIQQQVVIKDLFK